MLIVETIARVRRDHHILHKPIKQIARERGLSRNTVRKILRTDETSFSYERDHQPLPRLGGHVVALERMLEENQSKSRRERLTLMRMFELLQAEGYDGGYDAIRRHVRRWRAERVSVATGVFIPLYFAPGEAYQFDWSHEIVVLGGVTTTVKAAHVRLCHSRAFLVICYPRETQEMVFDAHDRAFHFFGGSCRRGIYDNMGTAVDAVFAGKDRRFNRRFEQLCSHHLVEPVACTPAAGWEKGQVENQVGNVREWFFTPRPRFNSLKELNSWLEEQCRRKMATLAHPEIKDRTVADVFAEETAALVPYRGAFDGFHETQASASKSALVRFDRNRYSVAAKSANRPVAVRAYADRVVIRQDGEVVGEHTRAFGRDQTIFDPWHYVPALLRKPGALRNGAPFRDWDLPPWLASVRRKLGGGDDADRQFVAILSAVMDHGLEAVERACMDALAGGVCTATVILNHVSRQEQPVAAPSITTPGALRLASPPMADCARYDSLRGRRSTGGCHGAP